MNASFARSRLRLSLMGCVLGAALAGCGGDAIQNGPAQPQLGLTNIDIINDFFVANGCAAAGACHAIGGPGGASFEMHNANWIALTPAQQLENRIFMEGQVDFNDHTNSALLVKPSGDKGATHVGGTSYFTPSDQIYQDILAWMNSTP